MTARLIQLVTCNLVSRPYHGSTPIPKKKQIYIHVDQNDGDVTTTSNFEDHKVSQVIEPVVKTITSAIRSRFNKQDDTNSPYDTMQAPNRRTNPPIPTEYDYDAVDSSNNVGYPLDYTYSSDYNDIATSPTTRTVSKPIYNMPQPQPIYEVTPRPTYSSPEPSITSLMRLSELRNIYNVPKPPVKKKQMKPKYRPPKTNRNDKSKFIYYY